MQSNQVIIIESSLGPKTTENLKEDIIGIKTIIESLAEEVSKLETRKKQYTTEIKNNENLLNNILEELSRDNKTFLSKLQTVVEKKSNLTLTGNESFIKKNYRKIRETLEEKSIKIDGEAGKSVDKKRGGNRSRNNSQTSKEELLDLNDKNRELELENQFMLRKIANSEEKNLPGFIRNLALSKN